MTELKIEISKEEFDKLKAMSYGQRSPLVIDKLPERILMGYGYYGHILKEVDGKYLIVCDIGSSCD